MAQMGMAQTYEIASLLPIYTILWGMNINLCTNYLDHIPRTRFELLGMIDL
jgi:hypothetical protein